MVNNSVKQNIFYKNDSFLNQFPAIIGILSVLSYPIFSSIWGMEPIGIGKYVELLVAFSLLFLFLLILSGWVELVRGLFTLYVTLVMPAFCILASLTVVGVLSASEYGMALVILHVTYILIWFFTRNYVLNLPLFNQINRVILSLLPLGYGIIFWAWVYGTYGLLQPKFRSAWFIVPAIVFLLLFCLWAIDLRQRRSQSGYKWVIYSLMGLLLIGLVYRPELFFDREHYNFFMAPLNDFIRGEIPFVDTTSQYGIGVIYVLAIVFRGLYLPMGYEGLSFIINILFILQYMMLAFMLWRTTEDLTFGIVGLLAIVYFNYLSVYWPSMLRTPAQSPLRYGVVYLLLCTALFNIKLSNRYLQILELVFFGVASIWSLETFLYVLISLDAFYFVKDILFASRFDIGIKCFGRRIMLQMGIVTVLWGVFLIWARTASGQFPDLNMYLDYFRAYSNISYDGGTIAPHVFRSGAVIFVYLFSIFAVFFDSIQQKRFLSQVVASILVGMSVAGILQYAYYFVYYIDYHLALLCVPLIFVLALWASIIWHQMELPLLLRTSVGVVLIISLTISAIVSHLSFYEKYSNSLLYISLQTFMKNRYVSLTNPYQVSPSSGSVENLVYLIENYVGNDQQIAIFAAPDDQTEALFLTGKTDLLGMSEPEMSSISPVYSEFVLQKATEKMGQPMYIFYDNAKDALIPLQQDAYRILVSNMVYKVVDKRRNIVVLKRVD